MATIRRLMGLPPRDLDLAQAAVAELTARPPCGAGTRRQGPVPTISLAASMLSSSMTPLGADAGLAEKALVRS